MKLIGLTGGIGMGKSTAARLLAEHGIAVIDTDVLAREVVEPGQPALEEVCRAFGPEVIGADGRLNREALARIVFADGARRHALEIILHPRIRERWQGQAAAWWAEGRAFGVVVIPLLYETRAEKELDCVICVACSLASQQQRLAARGWDARQIGQRIAAQWPVEQKAALANFVIWTEGGMEVHDAQIRKVLDTLASDPP